MELISLAKEAFQSVAEYAASYRLGQTALRYLDRTLWVVEKCARWAVPPPLDQDERPQPELVRPLPWVFFLIMLVTLRVTRESISLVNLIMGKPPLRSADVVMYIQSKRRYLRTLKYQGNRMQRARSSGTQHTQSWSHSLRSLFEFTMCFRRQSSHYGNNNTTSVSNNDEVLVVKRSKRGRQQTSPVASTSETTMERLIEKMLVDLDADSDDDSSFTLTNVTSAKSDRSDFTVESDQEITIQNNTSDKNEPNSDTQQTSENVDTQHESTSDTPPNTPEKQYTENTTNTPAKQNNKNTTNTPKSQQTGNTSSTPEKQHPGNAINTPQKQHMGNTPNKSERQHTENTPNSQSSYGTWHSTTLDSHVTCNTPNSLESSQAEDTLNTPDSLCSELQQAPRSSSTPDKSRLASFLDQERYISQEDFPKEVRKKSQEISPSKIPRTPVVEQKMGTKLKIWSNKLKEKFSKSKPLEEHANGRTVKRVPSKKKASKSMEKDKRNTEVNVEINSNNTL